MQTDTFVTLGLLAISCFVMFRLGYWCGRTDRETAKREADFNAHFAKVEKRINSGCRRG